MDYGELKEKYGKSSESGVKRPPIEIILGAVLAIAIGAALYFIYFQSTGPNYSSSASKTEDLLNKMSSITLAGDTKSIIEFERCDSLEKLDNEWVISGCEGGSTVHMFFTDDGQYYMTVCGGWADGKDLLARSPKVLEAFGFPTQCDASSVILVGTDAGTQIYNICGTKIYIKDGCIV